MKRSNPEKLVHAGRGEWEKRGGSGDRTGKIRRALRIAGKSRNHRGGNGSEKVSEGFEQGRRMLVRSNGRYVYTKALRGGKRKKGAGSKTKKEKDSGKTRESFPAIKTRQIHLEDLLVNKHAPGTAEGTAWRPTINC